MMSGYSFSWGGMILMLLGMALSIALLVVLVWALFNWLTRKSSATVPLSPVSTSSSQSALEILQQRYARGEIETATFESMREQLGASPRSQFEKQTTAGGP
jgi:putative membrane protein